VTICRDHSSLWLLCYRTLPNPCSSCHIYDRCLRWLLRIANACVDDLVDQTWALVLAQASQRDDSRSQSIQAESQGSSQAVPRGIAARLGRRAFRDLVCA